MTHYQWDMEYMDNIMPWERKIYVSMLEKYVKDKNEEIKRQNQANSRGQTIEHP